MITIEKQQTLAIGHLADELTEFGLTLKVDKKLYNNGQGFFYFRPIFIISDKVLNGHVEFDGTINYTMQPNQDHFIEDDFIHLNTIMHEYRDVFILVLDALMNQTGEE